MTQESYSETSTQLLAGQAVYTWSTESITGESGDGFVAISPSLESRMALLKNLPATVTQFVGGSVISRDERLTYQPVGRHMDGSEAVLFRKVDGGNDSHGRPGRYIVHIIVGQREYMPLSSLYTIYNAYWLTADEVPLNYKPHLADIAIESPRDYEITSLDPDAIGAVAASVHQLVRSGSIEISGYSADAILAILSCLPAWVDSNAVLTPVWSSSGPTAKLAVYGNPSAVKGADYRASCEAPELSAIRCQYADVPTIGSADRLQKQKSRSKRTEDRAQRKAARHATRSARRGFRKSPVSPGTVIDAPASGETNDRLTAAIAKWQRIGSKKLSVQDKRVIEQSPAYVLNIVRQSQTKLPDKVVRGQVDALAVRVLKACGDPQYWPTVRDCLPSTSSAISRYVRAAPEPSVLLAGFFINLSEDRRFEIILDRALSNDTAARVLAAARADQDLTRGLCESMRLSCYSRGCLLGGLLSGGAFGYEWLFSDVLPNALDEEDGCRSFRGT